MSTPMDSNRDHWDEATDIHARGNVYGIEDFRAGRCQLHRIDVEELGDVTGKTLLHLQCHFGLGTLSWARRGAVVTGVDFSPKAIALARSLAAEVGLAARFVESNVYDLPAALAGRFDIVFCSYGVLCWLPDLKRWGEIVARYLEPGGIFYIAEAHPFIRVFPMDNDIRDGSTELRPYFSYFHDPAGTRWEPDTDYADEAFRELPYCVWKVVAFTEPAEVGSWRLSSRFPRLPMMFSLRATKPLA